MVSWETLPKAKRARVTQAVHDALAAKLTALAKANGVSPEPPEVDAVLVTGTDEEFTVHFVAHKMTRDSPMYVTYTATHSIYVGHATSGPNRPVTIELTEEHCDVLSENEDDEYRPRVVVQRIREQVLARVQGLPVPPPIPEASRAKQFVEDRAREIQRQYELAKPTLVIRCPRCGSTRAGAEDYVEEYTVMKCLECGLRAFIEDYEIRTDWNVPIVLAPGEAIPAFLPPLAPPVPAPEPEHAPIPPLPVEPPPKVSRRPAPIVPYTELGDVGGDSWTKDVTDLRCPRCDSPQVYDDTGRAERHFTFLSCRSCDHGEELSSLSAIDRWRRR